MGRKYHYGQDSILILLNHTVSLKSLFFRHVQTLQVHLHLHSLYHCQKSLGFLLVLNKALQIAVFLPYPIVVVENDRRQKA